MKNMISSARHALDVRRAAKNEWNILDAEIAAYSTEADRRDLEAMLDRYSDAETLEMRRMLVAQSSYLV